MTYAAAHHQGATEAFWPHFWGALRSSVSLVQSMSHPCCFVRLLVS